MSEVKKIATRESYGNALTELGKEHEDVVVLDADLAAATKTGVFKKAFPERHIDCGIAEIVYQIEVTIFLYRSSNLLYNRIFIFLSHYFSVLLDFFH